MNIGTKGDPSITDGLPTQNIRSSSGLGKDDWASHLYRHQATKLLSHRDTYLTRRRHQPSERERALLKFTFLELAFEDFPKRIFAFDNKIIVPFDSRSDLLPGFPL